MRRWLALLLYIMTAPLWAQTIGVISDVSNNQVPINATFDGHDLFVFGALTGDVKMDRELIITIEGPSETVKVLKKNRVGGLWMNDESVTIANMPSYMAVTSTGPLDDISTAEDRDTFSIGIDDRIEIRDGEGAENPDDFAEALKRIRSEKGLYVVEEGLVNLRGNALYSVEVALPSNLRDGLYQVRTYVVVDKTIIARSLATVNVRKAGLERWLYKLSVDDPLYYGIFAIFIAIFVAFAARQVAALFRR